MPSCRSTSFAVLAAALALVAAGCGDEDQIEQYTVVKPDVLTRSVQPASAADVDELRELPVERYPARTLGAIIPHGEMTWFFKLLGPRAEVAAQEQSFREFVRSVKFAADKPTWTLPQGWREQPQPPGGLRFATIVIPSEGERLELTVIPLGTPAGDPDEYLLANINRWRNELSLPEIEQAELGDHAERLQVGERTATLVNIAGQASKSGSMGRPPFAGVRADRGEFVHPPIGAGSERPATDDSLPIAFETPAGWQPGKSGPFRLAAFEVSEGHQTAEITVSSMSPQELLPNVNRWRGQVGLNETTPTQLEREVRPIEADRAPGQLVELNGPEQAILAAIVDHGGRAWIFKLQGPSGLAQREKDRFEAFVRSVRFK